MANLLGAKQVAQLLADLDHDKAAVGEQATRTLESWATWSNRPCSKSSRKSLSRSAATPGRLPR
jgi:hypothetical protein